MQLSPSRCSTALSGPAARQAGQRNSLLQHLLSALHEEWFKTTVIVNCSRFPSCYKWGMKLLAAVCCRVSSVRRPP